MIRPKVFAAAGLAILTAASASAQSRPLPPVVGITAAEIQTVLQHKGAEGAGVDRQIKVADLGDYKLGVGVLYRGPTKPGAPIAAFRTSLSSLRRDR